MAARRAFGRVFGWGIAVMILGYGLYCPARMWDLAPADGLEKVEALATHPVIPDWSKAAGIGLAPLPFVETTVLMPDRLMEKTDGVVVYKSAEKAGIVANYWIMDKRVTSASFIVFATGFAMAIYGLFILGCDVFGLRVGVFRTLGTNALAAYVIHHLVERAVQNIAPSDSPEWWCWASFGIFFGISWLLVRGLEKQGIYIKL
jgi:hypothetical protein